MRKTDLGYLPYVGEQTAVTALRTLPFAVSHMAQAAWPCGYDVTDAPDYAPTYDDLLRQTAERDRITVSTLNCENNIYGSVKANCDFRAWHDRVHIVLGLDFSPENELKVAEYQCDQLRRAFKWTSYLEAWCALIYADVAAPINYFSAHGHFPVGQARAVAGYITANEA